MFPHGRRPRRGWHAVGVDAAHTLDISVVDLLRQNPAPEAPLLYDDLAQPYLRAARQVLADPSPANCRAAEHAAFFLACRYTSMDSLQGHLGGSPREAQLGWQLFTRARTYRALAGHQDDAAATTRDPRA